jgi:hypothetical protein
VFCFSFHSFELLLPLVLSLIQGCERNIVKRNIE